MITFAEPLFPAMGAMGLLLQVFCGLPFDHGALHTLKQCFGFCQGQAKVFRPERITLQMDNILHGFGGSTVGFNNDLHF
jgi:hypothetical protein